jgi:predicted aspartyl protease
MTGEVDPRGSPILRLHIAGREWIAVIDTGFDGELELPAALSDHFHKSPSGPTRTTLGGGRVVDEELFLVDFPFDGDVIPAEAVFAPVDEILIGTTMLLSYRLEINFVTRTVVLEKVTTP